MDEEIWDAVIAGGSVAGLAAALMLGRVRRHVLVIDEGRPRNRFAAHMHGVLGHDGRPPGDLVAAGRAEAEGYGVAFVRGVVADVARGSGEAALVVTDADGAVHRTRSLIVATGIADELPPVPGLVERWGASVLHCPYCHGWEVSGRRIGVLATSAHSLHQAELVRQLSDRVTLFASEIDPLPDAVEHRLRSRGVAIEREPVVAVGGEGGSLEAVELGDGRSVPVDALFVVAAAVPHDGFVARLGLDRTETPMGSFLAVDAAGRTSDERIWAAGNVVNPGANVPMAIGAGTMTGAAVNAALVAAEFEAAAAGAPDGGWPEVATAEFWEQRYAESDRVWSSHANATMADVVRSLVPGRALDVGSGEGADVVWLAGRGWDATGVDVSETAVRRATEAAASAGVADRARFVVGTIDDLPVRAFDLVTSSFLHAPAGLPREEVLRRAAERVAPGGTLLIVGHAAAPPWAPAEHARKHRLLGPEEEFGLLALDADDWEVVAVEKRQRDALDPDGRPAVLEDGLVLLRRR